MAVGQHYADRFKTFGFNEISKMLDFLLRIASRVYDGAFASLSPHYAAACLETVE
jgi:hypothetical protein